MLTFHNMGDKDGHSPGQHAVAVVDCNADRRNHGVGSRMPTILMISGRWLFSCANASWAPNATGKHKEG